MAGLLAGTMTDTGSGVFSLSGRLMLGAAGLDHILPPARFTDTVHAAGVVSGVVTCVPVTAMTATMPASVAVQVVRGAATVPLMAGAVRPAHRALAAAACTTPVTSPGSPRSADYPGRRAGLRGCAAGRRVRGRRPAHRCRDRDPRRRGHVRPLPVTALTAGSPSTGCRRSPSRCPPASGVYGNVSFPGLRLVTCGGPFDSATRQYLDDAVVHAHPITSDR